MMEILSKWERLLISMGYSLQRSGILYPLLMQIAPSCKLNTVVSDLKGAKKIMLNGQIKLVALLWPPTKNQQQSQVVRGRI